MPEKQTFALDVPGAVLTYDVREAQTPTDEPPIVMIGSPMGANGFTTLAAHFTDRTIVTYDPRGVERSTVEETAAPATPYTHADDVHRLIREVSTAPVDLVASSGGAVNALALVEKYPGDARTLVAHEPPLDDLLPDREQLRAAMRDVHETYLAKGFGHGMAKFIRLVMHQGEFTDDYLAQPDPDPAMFGLPAEDDGSRDDPLMGVDMDTVPAFHLNAEGINAAPTRIVIGVGEESAQVMTGRASYAVAEALGQEATVFPGGHNGFMGGEYGQPAGKPVEFAAKLRTVLEGR